MTLSPLIRYAGLGIRFLFVRLRFCYCFFSPTPHDVNLASRYRVRWQLRPLWTLTTDERHARHTKKTVAVKWSLFYANWYQPPWTDPKICPHSRTLRKFGKSHISPHGQTPLKFGKPHESLVTPLFLFYGSPCFVRPLRIIFLIIHRANAAKFVIVGFACSQIFRIQIG